MKFGMVQQVKFLFNVRKLDFVHIKQYLERKGWTVSLFNTPAGDKLIEKLGLQDLLSRCDGFVYDLQHLKYVFINNDLSDKDKTITLLHEVGHIELEQDLTTHDKTNELEAWSFACTLFNIKEIFKSQLIFVGIDLLIVTSTFLGAVFAIKGI